MTIKEFSRTACVSTRTVQRWIDATNKAQGTTFASGVNDPISRELIIHLERRAGLSGQNPTPVHSHDNGTTAEVIPAVKPSPAGMNPPRQPAATKQPTRRIDLTTVLPILPLPMLGLAASFGVFSFSSMFAPSWVAIGEAAAFELTYIGLSSMRNLTDRQQVVARRVSIGAVVVSVIYNTLAGVIHYSPTMLQDLSVFWLWVVAVIHGSPLAILAFFVADLIFHQKK